jgi:hypothetical protein
MRNEIKLICQHCKLCTKFAKKLPREKEMMDPYLSTEPLDRVACDLFTYQGSQYLMVIDEFKNYGFHHRYNKAPCTEEVTRVLETWFLQVGHPARLQSDRGPHFHSEFNCVLKEQRYSA